MGKKTGELICQARTKAKLSQAQLAKIVSLTTGEIKKAEAGEIFFFSRCDFSKRPI